MKIIIYGMFLLGIITFNSSVYGQTKTTQSKSCGSCGKAVSNNSKVGMTCPHCRVRWGYENERTTTTYDYNSRTDYNYNNSPKSYNSYNSSKTIGLTSSNVNLRTEPNTKSKIITVIPAYSSVSIIEKTGNWYYVRYSSFDYKSYRTREINGYVHKSLVN